MSNLREAAEVLMNKLVLVTNSTEYQRVFITANQHNGQYSGPTYAPELATLTAALALPDARPELDKLKRIAMTGTADSFLALDDDAKRLWFANFVDHSSRVKKARASLEEYEHAASHVARERCVEEAVWLLAGDLPDAQPVAWHYEHRLGQQDAQTSWVRWNSLMRANWNEMELFAIPQPVAAPEPVAELEAMRADAARYQFLRESAYIEFNCGSPRVHGWEPNNTDAAVDAAIAQTVK